MIRLSTTFLYLIFSSFLSAQDVTTLKQINEDVWKPFCMAYDSLDATILAKVHSKDVLRIPGNAGSIIYYQEYMDRFNVNFQKAKESGDTREISLRFFERIHDGKTASERGFYRLIVNKGTSSEQTYYGKFHVILKLENLVWKILIDYDSNEQNSVGPQDFNEAFAMDDLTRFIDPEQK